MDTDPNRICWMFIPMSKIRTFWTCQVIFVRKRLEGLSLIYQNKYAWFTWFPKELEFCHTHTQVDFSWVWISLAFLNLTSQSILCIRIWLTAKALAPRICRWPNLNVLIHRHSISDCVISLDIPKTQQELRYSLRAAQSWSLNRLANKGGQPMSAKPVCKKHLASTFKSEYNII